MGDKRLYFFFVVWACLAIAQIHGLSLVEISHSARSGEAPDVAARRMEAEFAPWNDQQVTLRGFLYRTADDRWILSSQPDLKTCCVGSPSKMLSQIIVESDANLESAEKVIALRGTFQIRPHHDKEGTLLALFYLTQAEIAAPDADNHTLPKALIAGILCAIALFAFSLRLIRKQPC